MIAKVVIPAAAALLAGILIGVLGSDNAGSTAGHTQQFEPSAGAGGPTESADYAAIVDSLSALVNLEVAERRRLEAEVEALSAQVASLESLLGPFGDTPASAARVEAADREREKLMAQNQAGSDAQIQRFIAAGFAPDQAAYLKQRQDEIAMDRLFVRDQAIREGWQNTERYADALRELSTRNESLRAELGDDDYDRYLYAIGRPNRVVVRNVLESSPAQNAGLQPGDEIISYDGDRIFDMRTLISSTSDGSAGATTPVEVMRDGQRLVLYIARGPLGVNMRVGRVQPEG